MRLLLIAALLYAMPFTTSGQQVKQHVPVVTLGRIRLPETKDGKLVPVNTTRQEMLKNTLFIADVNNCRVIRYKFSIIAPGQPYYGPVYVSSGELTDSLKNKIKSQNGPNVKVFIEDMIVNYRGNEMEVNSLAYKYDE